ncbi:MAG: TIGR02281 family clan AA aspartic protease [Burkholderiales bacterium]|nr:TIGR02281 family clan AA aspartic protease [Burkholderiales bacterium]
MYAGSIKCTTAPGQRGPVTMLLALLLALPCISAAQELAIEIAGLSAGKAIVVAGGGRPKVYRDGDILPGGARLVRATPEGALFELDGKRQMLRIGSHVSTAPTTRSGAQRVSLTADARGHFEAIGTIDGASVRFLVDTGATTVSMGADDARRIGIDYLRGQPGYASTANGTIKVHRVRLNSVRVGEIALTNVEASVHDTRMPFVLLGMSFLNRVEMNRQGDTLTLVRRF